MQVNQVLVAHPEEEGLYRALARLAVPLLGDWGGVAMLQGERLEHVTLLSPAPLKTQAPWSRPSPFNTRVIHAGRAQLLSGSTASVPRAIAEDEEHQQQLQGAGLQDFMAAPLFREGVSRGCLWFASTDPMAPLGLEELKLAEQLALLASPALEAARLHAVEQQGREHKAGLKQKTESLSRVASALGKALLPAQVADAVMGEIKTALHAWASVVYRLDASGEALELLRSRGYGAEATRGFERLPLELNTPITVAVRRREGIWVESAEAFRRDYPELAARVPPRPGARVALPLLIEGRVLGVLAMSFETDHSFSDEERAFGLVLAQLCSQALERAQLCLRLQGQLEELRTLLDVLPIGLVISRDRECEQVEQNLALTRMLGPAAHVFHRGRELEPEDQPLQRAASSGFPVLDFEMEVEQEGGPRRTLLSYATPLFDPTHRLRGAVGAFLDITERKRATEALQLLADSGPLLSASRDPKQTFQGLTRLCIPTLSRLALLYTGTEQRLQLMSYAHEQPSLEPLLAELGVRTKLLELPLLQRALKKGKSVSLDVWRALARISHDDAELSELPRRLAVREVLLLPLVVSKRVVGLLVCGVDEEHSSKGTRTLARAFAQRAAFAVDNASLYREAREAREASAAGKGS